MSSIIYIKDLVIEAKHGVHVREKQNSQRFSISVELTVDTKQAGESDDLADTINWSELRQTIISTVQDNTFNLMERLAMELANQILSDPRVERVVVLIDKLDAFPAGGIPGIRLEVNQTATDGY